MYQYQMTDPIARDLRRIEQLRRELDAVGPLPRLWLGRTRRDVEAEAVAASTRLEGVAVTVDETRRILAGDRPWSVSVEDAELVEGYRDAMHYVLARADDPNYAWHTELLLAIHHRILAGSRAAGAGRLRTGQNWVTNVETGEATYLPPAPELVPAHMNELACWLGSFDGMAAVAAAMGHVRLAAIHPFRDGNGRAARILASLVMYRAGYRAPEFTSLEEWWGRHVAEYYAAFSCLGDRWDPDTDVTSFIETHIHGQVTQVEALSLRAAVERAIWTVVEDMAVMDLGLHPRAGNALFDAFFAREVTNRYYRGLADVTQVTAAHDLGRLAASGLLISRGAGRSSHYLGSERLIEAVARSAGVPAERVPVGGSLVERRDAVVAALAERLHGGT
jgi:Fic family protein